MTWEVRAPTGPRWFRPQEPIVDIDPVVEYAATFGRIAVHRAYCNWQYYGRYRDELQAHAVDLVQLFPLAGSKMALISGLSSMWPTIWRAIRT